MGSMYIQGFIDQGIDLDTCLRIHLSSNHYPPVHSDFIPACKEAINCYYDDELDKEITLPNGKVKTALEIIEGLHLESFLD